MRYALGIHHPYSRRTESIVRRFIRVYYLEFNMQQTFCFVNGTHVDKLTKKRMRRHVMMGKNAGRTIKRKSRIDVPPHQVANMTAVSSVALRQEPVFDRFAYLDNYKPDNIYNNVLSGLSFPVKITPQFAEIVSNFFLFIAHKLYPVALGISIEKSKYTLLSILMSDKAAFYCNIALMQACNELFLGDGEKSPAAIYHLSNSLKYVRERLESEEALSDSTMGMVMSLITQEQCRQQHKAARIHMDGLAQMIKLRGGLESLEGCLPILLKACKTDLMYALQCEDTPRFHRSHMPQIISTLHSLDLPFNREAARKQVQHPNLDSALLDVLIDVICATTLFNDLHSTRKVDLYFFQEILVDYCYRLLAIPHLHSPQTLEDAYHVGLKIFMMSLFLQVGSQRIMNYDNVTERLKMVLESDILDGENELRFWLLMMGGVWVADNEDVEWLVLVKHAQTRKMGLGSWSEAKQIVEMWPWIGRLHDAPGKLFWDRTRR
ncbi:uncharacterized protein CC84DRAFT_459240 [Paraphaeosphaeria sporulosa]|uniref:Fungal-specific transcription factor domain-containing protein n=1 Tax=Paraphaeosphaeria sporulosa TaxID=1460663 RepID=A0A177CR56_9PLEO|nr:uncharacterized protein CC84DRAFT_459240 [Paraphaeosphaeria sporulosa]OAG10003.1 hypothetical protein CC84DRAFT_459240 [Paraphaeosphaeria sporulosa]